MLRFNKIKNYYFTTKNYYFTKFQVKLEFFKTGSSNKEYDYQRGRTRLPSRVLRCRPLYPPLLRGRQRKWHKDNGK